MQMDCLDAIREGWDLVIAHPPCTHLSSSGAKHFATKRADGRQQAGVNFFMAVVKACEKHATRWAIENPIGIMSRIYRKPDQIIQPYNFGHDASKATCLWLHGLPPLKPSGHFPGRKVSGRLRWANQTDSGQNRLTPSADRWKIRSATFPGIARAMAEQWSIIEPSRGNPMTRKIYTMSNTEIHTWAERNRLTVELRRKGDDKTLIAWRDEEVNEAVQDGFLPFGPDSRGHGDRKLHVAALEYYNSHNLRSNPGGYPHAVFMYRKSGAWEYFPAGEVQQAALADASENQNISINVARKGESKADFLERSFREMKRRKITPADTTRGTNPADGELVDNSKFARLQNELYDLQRRYRGGKPNKKTLAHMTHLKSEIVREGDLMAERQKPRNNPRRNAPLSAEDIAALRRILPTIQRVLVTHGAKVNPGKRRKATRRKTKAFGPGKRWKTKKAMKRYMAKIGRLSKKTRR